MSVVIIYWPTRVLLLTPMQVLQCICTVTSYEPIINSSSKDDAMVLVDYAIQLFEA